MIPNDISTPSLDGAAGVAANGVSADTAQTTDVSADTTTTDSLSRLEADATAAEAALSAAVASASEILFPLPAPGAKRGDRTVRASGTLPQSGDEFVIYRHSARQELSALAGATSMAEVEHDTSDQGIGGRLTAILLAFNTQLRTPGTGQWRSLNADDVLDLDAEDFTALNKASTAGRPKPVPPSPTS